MSPLNTGRKQFFFLLLSLICMLIACSKDEKPAPEIPQPVNLPPKAFEVFIGTLSDSSALINWEVANDPENDSVSYSLYLEGTALLQNTYKLDLKITGLKEQTTYRGKVIAKDSKNNETTKAFTFTTPKYYLKFAKSFTFAPSTSAEGGNPGSMIKTRDGRYVVAGTTTFNGNGYQFYVLMVDYDGKELWKKYYPYQVGNYQNLKITESSKGFLLAGVDHLIHLDYQGNLLWHKQIETLSLAGRPAVFQAVKEDSKGNIYLVGGRPTLEKQVWEEAILIKLNASGTILFEKSYRPTFRNVFYDITISPSDELIILGSAETSGTTSLMAEQMDFWVVKMNTGGEIIWQQTYGDSRYDHVRQIILTKDGNYAFTGFSWGEYDRSEGRVFKISPTGAEIWNKSSSLFSMTSIAETQDGGFVTTGFVMLPNSGIIGLLKLDQAGNTEWNQYYQEGFAYLRGQAVIAENDGGFRIAASRFKNYYYNGDRPHILIYKTDPKGNFE